jgi:hypothetical protein
MTTQLPETEEDVIVRSVPMKGNQAVSKAIVQFVYITKENFIINLPTAYNQPKAIQIILHDLAFLKRGLSNRTTSRPMLHLIESYYLYSFYEDLAMILISQAQK